MRGKLNSFTAGGRQVFVYAPPGAERPLPLVQMAAGEELAAQLPQVMGEVEPLLGRGCAPFLLAWTAPVDWERDYTPWPAPALPGRPPFAGGADAYLDLLAGTVRPAVAARFDILSGPGDTALAGYSLGGLLALYGLLSRPEYGRAASLSGSLWYDGWAACQTGIADSATQAALYAQNAPDNKLDNRGETAPGKSKEMDWWTSGIQEIFARGKTATVTDVVTGLSWQVVRSGGTNHADVQPKTAQDTPLMKKAYGGTWSWNRRAIWVSIGGEKYAASMNGMPHGSDSIKDNDFDGHHCIHFTNSRTHGTNVVCALHQAAIRKALAAG